jgi:hypothetical protein
MRTDCPAALRSAISASLAVPNARGRHHSRLQHVIPQVVADRLRESPLSCRLAYVRRQGGPCRPPAASEVRSRPAVPNRAVCQEMERFSPVLVTWVTFTSFVSAITCSRSRKHNTRLGNLLRITCTTGEVTCFAKSFTFSPWVEFLQRRIRSLPTRSLQPWPNMPRLLRLLRRRPRRRLPPCRRHRRRPRQRGTSPKRMLLSDLAGVRKEHGHEPSCSGLCTAVSVACRE